MRTTLDIDDDILMAVREIASTRHKTMGEVLSELARRTLAGPDGRTRTKNGIPQFPRRKGVVVTMEAVQSLQDEE